MAGRTPSSVMRISPQEDVGPQLDRLKKLSADARNCVSNFIGTKVADYRFAARPDLAADPNDQAQRCPSCRLWLERSISRSSRSQMEDAAGLAESLPRRFTFILQHAGMLEDTSSSQVGIKAWRAGMRRLAECPKMSSPSYPVFGTFIAPERSGLHRKGHDQVKPLQNLRRQNAALFGSNFPIEKIWTSVTSRSPLRRFKLGRAKGLSKAEDQQAIFQGHRGA